MNRPLTVRLDEEDLTALVSEIVDRKLDERSDRAQPDLLTADEAAELLRCDRRRIYRMHGDGRLAYEKDGRRLLIPRAEIDRHLNGERSAC